MKSPSKNTSSPSRKKRKRSPKHTAVARSYSFPVEVSPRQGEIIRGHISSCWRIRNYFVEKRALDRAVNRTRKQSGEKTDYLTRADQYADIREYAKRDIGIQRVHSQVLQNVAVRVDEGYKRFFEGLADGKKNVRPPRYIIRKKYQSLTYPQYGTAAHIKNGVLHLSKLGDFRVNGYRKIKGKPKTVTIKWKQGRWWAIVTAEAQQKDVVKNIALGDRRMDIGVDPGLASLLHDSEGNSYDPPKVSSVYQKKLGIAQRAMSRKFEARKKDHARMKAICRKEGAKETPLLRSVPYSNRLRRQIAAVAKIHTKILRCRDHYHKKNAAVIASKFRMVAVEEHPVMFMIRNRKLARAASDRAIHKQKQLLRSKLGPRYIEAPNRLAGVGGNSQRCVCGAAVPKNLGDRIHSCPVCGITADRDHMSANIVAMDTFGFASLSLPTPAAGQAVVIRGEDKAACGEIRCGEPGENLASEFSVKRKPPVHEEHTTDAEAAVGDNTMVHRKGEHRPALAVASNAPHTAITTVRRYPPKGVKELNLGR